MSWALASRSPSQPPSPSPPQTPTQGSLNASLGLVQFAVGKTVLPNHIAEAITGLSIMARVSLRATAFFLEVILEATKFGTGIGMGLTRRALIGAIGAARTMHALTPATDNLVPGGPADGLNAALMSILDRYTAAGIYVVHHTLTMTELMAMSGLCLVQDSIKTGVAVAEESVRIIDGVFGSNETSRALSKFIELVKRESDRGDGRHIAVNTIKTFAAITRALTTFAVVQAATHRRTAKQHSMKVVYDCTVLGEAETQTWRALIRGPSKFQPTVDDGVMTRPSMLKSRSARRSRAPSIAEVSEGESQDTEQLKPLIRTQDSCLTDVRATQDSMWPAGLTPSSSASSSLMQSLDFFCGEDEGEEGEGEGQGGSRPNKKISVSQLNTEEDLPRTLRNKLSLYDDEELNRGVVIAQDQADAREVKQVVRRRRDTIHRQTVWEIVTETTEITELVTETTTTSSPAAAGEEEEDDRPGHVQEGSDSTVGPSTPEPELAGAVVLRSKRKVPKRIKNPFQMFTAPTSRFTLKRGERTTDRDVTMTTRGFETDSVFSDGRKEHVKQDEQEWTEVATMREQNGGRGDTPESSVDSSSSSLPSAPNGAAPRRKMSLTAARSRQSSIDDPSGSKQRMRVVLKQVQKRLVKKTTVTREDVEEETHAHIEEEPRRSDTKKPALEVPAREAPSSSSSSSHQTPKRHRALSVSSMRSYATRQHAHFKVTEDASASDPNRDSAFPRRPLIHNLRRFGRFASACYGVHFLNILGLSGNDGGYMFKNTANTHANVWAFAHHVGVGVHDVLLSSYCADAAGEEAFFHSHRLTPIVNFVVVDHASEAVVLACRGTLGLSDILVDLTCDYDFVRCESGQGWVHGGIFESARRLATNTGLLKTTLRECLEAHPTYGLVTVGHSLGGGIAALLAMQWSTPAETFRQSEAAAATPAHPPIRTAFVTSVSSGLPPGRPIHSYTYGPAAVVDADLSEALHGLVTSMVHGNDVVPCFSLGLVRDMRDIGVVLEQAAGEGAAEILGRTIGLYQRSRKAAAAAAAAANSATAHLQGSASATSSNAGLLPADDEGLAAPLPRSERSQIFDVSELQRGHTQNRADHDSYEDPYKQVVKPDEEGDDGAQEQDWLWSLIKTMRAHAANDKLYPPGEVYVAETFQVYVSAASTATASGSNGSGSAATATSTTAHRVILRSCPKVQERFSEPIFSRSLFRDHSPSNYEFCLDLLWEGARGRQMEEEEKSRREGEMPAASS